MKKILKCPTCTTFLPLKKRSETSITCRRCGYKVQKSSSEKTKQQPISIEADIRFSLLFEDDFNSDQGDSGQAHAVRLVTGQKGGGVLIRGKATLSYPTATYIQPQQGSITFWLRPKWFGNDNQDHFFFDLGHSLRNHIAILKDGANNLRFIMWGPYSEHGVAYNVSHWLPDEWHHIGVTWSRNRLELYVDEKLVVKGTHIEFPTSLDSQFYIGSSSGGHKQAEAVIDEFIIYGQPLKRQLKKLSPKLSARLAPVPDHYTIPTLVIRYFPLKSGWVDRSFTGDVHAPLGKIRNHVNQTTTKVIGALQQGSTYHGYKDRPAKASLSYQIVDTLEFLEPLPTYNKRGYKTPMTDYNAIMDRVNIKHWVEEVGVKEVWLWGYHGDKVVLWESNMGSPYGDISNSNRDANDLPILDKTYTVYHYNYGRGPSEAVEDHMHQIEALLNYIDGRDVTPRHQWADLLFWGHFVGSDESHKIITPRCGWAHYPPNGERDYDWANPRYVRTDIEDWQPDGSGQKQRINCERWHRDSLTWFIYWMQNLPGAKNGLTYKGRPLTNWWLFKGDFDWAMKHQYKLVL